MGDVYTFLKQVTRYPYTMQTMYIYGIYGIPPNQRIEVYAINVHNRAAAQRFLNQYPRDDNRCEDTGYFAGDMFEHRQEAMRKFLDGFDNRSNIHPSNNAIALSFLMHELNMGITLSRKSVGHGSFSMIDVQQVNGGLRLRTCI